MFVYLSHYFPGFVNMGRKIKHSMFEFDRYFMIISFRSLSHTVWGGVDLTLHKCDYLNKTKRSVGTVKSQRTGSIPCPIIPPDSETGICQK